MTILDIDDLNIWAFKKNVRYYQLLIIKNIPFAITYDGLIYDFVNSTIDHNKNILLFNNNDIFINLYTDDIRSGYKLNKNIQIEPFDHSKACMVNNKYANVDIEKKIPSNDKSVVIVGHINFAHFIWNHLSSIYSLYNSGVKFDYYQSVNSICLVSDLIPNFNSIDIKKLDTYKNHLYVGGILIIDEVSIKLSKYIDKFDKFLNNNKNDSVVRIYFGLRGHGQRELINEMDFFFLLALKLKKKFPNLVIILDSFSFQLNNQEIPFYKNFCAEKELFISKFINKLKNNNINFESINGFPLIDSINYLKKIDYYITHEGTMQHKIGWVNRQTPGAIIDCRGLGQAVGLWHAEQVENAFTPYVLPEQFINIISKNSINIRENSFEINNLDDAVENIFNRILLYL